jgi:capsular polysaccharide biosynthesis protein
VDDFDLRNVQSNGQGRLPTNLAVDSDDTYVGMSGYEDLTSQVDPIRVIKRRLWMIVLASFVFAGVAAGFSFAQTPTYQASVMLLIGQEQEGDAPNNLVGDVEGLQQLAQTVATAVTTGPIIEGTAERVDTAPATLPESLSAEVIEGTTFVEIYYEDTDPERAQRIANAVGGVVSQRISEVSPGTNGLTATVWEEAGEPESPVSPDSLRNVLLGLLLGAMIGLGLAFLLDYLDDDWNSTEEVERVSGVSNFGVIPAFKIRAIKEKS